MRVAHVDQRATCRAIVAGNSDFIGVGLADFPLPHFHLEHIGTIRLHVATRGQNLDAGSGSKAERLGGVSHALTLGE